MSERSSDNDAKGQLVLLAALTMISDESNMKSEDYHVGYRYPDTVDEIVGKVRLTVGAKSIHYPGKYRFGKPEMVLCKKIHMAKRSEDAKTTSLFDVLLNLKQGFIDLGLEVRLTVAVDVDRKVIVNMEGVYTDGSNDCMRFHFAS